MPTEQAETKRTFEAFRDKFLELISSPYFGEPPRSRARKANHTQGPAYRELRKTGLLHLLRSRDFLRAAHQLVKEHARLESEKPKLAEVAGTARPIVGRYRYARKRLGRTQRELEEFDRKYGDLFEPDLKQHIYSAIEHIQTIEGLMMQRAKLWVSKVHPRLRKPKEAPSEWELLVKRYDYDLESVHLRAADHWLWQALNRALDGFVTRSGKTLSDMTRFKLVSAICEAAGIGPFEATTIKEYLLTNP